MYDIVLYVPRTLSLVGYSLYTFTLAMRLEAVSVAVLGVSSAAPELTLRINGVQASINLDTQVELGSSVSFSCKDDGSSRSVAGDLYSSPIDVEARYSEDSQTGG